MLGIFHDFFADCLLTKHNYAKAKAGLETGMWTMEFEAVLYVPCRAWARKHGKEAECYSYMPRISCETGSNQKGWA